MDDNTREQAERLLGHRFRNPAILEAALMHASVADCRLESNERMEFFGDSILGMVVCEYLYHRYPDLLEGELTKIKSAAVSRRSCSDVARMLGLDELLVTGKGMGRAGDLPKSLSAAVFETVIAAIYLDGGLEPARDFILRHMTEPIESAAASGHHENFKSVLQQHAQRHFGHSAVYVLLDEKGPDHAKCFEVCVEIDGRRFPSCWCPSKKQAEQRAALNALVELGAAKIDGRTQEPYLVAEDDASPVLPEQAEL